VEWLRDGVAAETALRGEQFSAIVLDLGLPRLVGLDLLRIVRSRGDRTPVVVLTARDAVDDRVKGLDSGADDYVVKPVAIVELAARLRALVRRAQGASSGELVTGELRIDPAARTATFRGQPVELALNVGRVLTRSQLESKLYEWGDGLDSNAIEVHIHHLRRKLVPSLIKTVRGVGYLIPRGDDDGG
jgi:DNA-binding response OmpR family regulator